MDNPQLWEAGSPELVDFKFWYVSTKEFHEI